MRLPRQDKSIYARSLPEKRGWYLTLRWQTDGAGRPINGEETSEMFKGERQVQTGLPAIKPPSYWSKSLQVHRFTRSLRRKQRLLLHGFITLEVSFRMIAPSIDLSKLRKHKDKTSQRLHTQTLCFATKTARVAIKMAPIASLRIGERSPLSPRSPLKIL
jgi:hypothetical protein